RGLPVVLEVGRPAPLAYFRNRNSLRGERGSRIAQQVRGGAIAGDVARERHVPERPVVGGGVIPQAAQVRADLDRMRAANDAEVVHGLIRAAVIEIRGRRAVAQADKTYDADNRKNRLILAQRSAVRTTDFESV